LAGTRLFSWLNKPLWPGKRNSKLNYTVGQDYSSSYWQEGTRRNIPHMFVVCTLHVTNTGPAKSGRIVKAYVKRDRSRFPNFINTNTGYPLGLTRSVTLNFEVSPPLAGSGESLVADVELMDQFGDGHTVKKVLFRHFGTQVRRS
jgi:hypothetical protein